MKNARFTFRRTDLKVLVIATGVAVTLISAAALKFWAARPYHAAGYSIVGDFATDADADTAAIRRDWPFRMVQPEWVSRTPDLFANWTYAETAARSIVMCVTWLVTTGLLISSYIRLLKAPTDLEHQPPIEL